MIIYALFVFVVLAILYTSMGKSTTTYTRKEFDKALARDEVKSVNITQNEEVPTGAAEITLTDGTEATLYVSDVNEIQEELKEIRGHTQEEEEEEEEPQPKVAKSGWFFKR